MNFSPQPSRPKIQTIEGHLINLLPSFPFSMKEEKNENLEIILSKNHYELPHKRPINIVEIDNSLRKEIHHEDGDDYDSDLDDDYNDKIPKKQEINKAKSPKKQPPPKKIKELETSSDEDDEFEIAKKWLNMRKSKIQAMSTELANNRNMSILQSKKNDSENSSKQHIIEKKFKEKMLKKPLIKTNQSSQNNSASIVKSSFEQNSSLEDIMASGTSPLINRETFNDGRRNNRVNRLSAPEGASTKPNTKVQDNIDNMSLMYSSTSSAKFGSNLIDISRLGPTDMLELKKLLDKKLENERLKDISQPITRPETNNNTIDLNRQTLEFSLNKNAIYDDDPAAAYLNNLQKLMGNSRKGGMNAQKFLQAEDVDRLFVVNNVMDKFDEGSQKGSPPRPEQIQINIAEPEKIPIMETTMKKKEKMVDREQIYEQKVKEFMKIQERLIPSAGEDVFVHKGFIHDKPLSAQRQKIVTVGPKNLNIGSISKNIEYQLPLKGEISFRNNKDIEMNYSQKRIAVADKQTLQTNV